MIEAKCICYLKLFKIFSINVFQYYEYVTKVGSKRRRDRLENTFIDVYFYEFRMFSNHEFFFPELSYVKSVTHSFLYGRMGSMSKSDPDSTSRFSIGDKSRGHLTFQKITKSMPTKNKKEQFLSITHECANYKFTSEYDYQEVKALDIGIGKALNLYDHRVIHPENLKILEEDWDAEDFMIVFENSGRNNLLLY